jgi:hypothetical protein
MTEVDWTLVRADYENTKLTILVLAEKYGVDRHAINDRRLLERWRPRRQSAAARETILARVYRILDRQTEKMEQAMEKGEETYGMSDLASVTRTLEKLISLNKAERQRTRNPPESDLMKALREKLADRIEQLNQG